MNTTFNSVEKAYVELTDLHNAVVVDEIEAIEALDDLNGTNMKILENMRTIHSSISKNYFSKKSALKDKIVEYISDIVKFNDKYNDLMDSENLSQNEKDAIKSYAVSEVKVVKESINTLVKKINEHNPQKTEDLTTNKFMFYLSEMANESENVKKFFDANEIFYAGILEKND